MTLHGHTGNSFHLFIYRFLWREQRMYGREVRWDKWATLGPPSGQLNHLAGCRKILQSFFPSASPPEHVIVRTWRLEHLKCKTNTDMNKTVVNSDVSRWIFIAVWSCSLLHLMDERRSIFILLSTNPIKCPRRPACWRFTASPACLRRWASNPLVPIGDVNLHERTHDGRTF